MLPTRLHLPACWKPPIHLIPKTAGSTLKEFQPLRPAERILLKNCYKGTVACVSRHLPRHASEENTVRASFLRYLALGGDTKTSVHAKGIQLCGAWIDGALNLTGAVVPQRLCLAWCRLDTRLVMHDCQILGCFDLRGCHVAGIDADGLICSSISLNKGFHSAGAVCLYSAEVFGNLDCKKGGFEGADSDSKSLQCANIRIGRAALLQDIFVTKGAVCFKNGEIGGDLTFTNGSLDGTDNEKISLLCDGVRVKGDVQLNERFSTTGTVSLLGAEIRGDLDGCNGSFKGCDEEGIALQCDSAKIGGSVFLRKVFVTNGAIRMPGAEIGGNLECDGANLEVIDSSKTSLACDGAKVRGDVFLARDSAKTKENELLEDCFRATGLVRLLGSQIGGDLVCRGGKFKGKGEKGNALACNRSTIRGSILLSDNFAAEGAVVLIGVRIGNNLNCEGGCFKGSAESGSLKCDNMQVEGKFIFKNLKEKVDGILLASAKVRRLEDDKESWGEKLILNGFTYDGFSGLASTDAEDRIKWLEQQLPTDLGKPEEAKQHGQSSDLPNKEATELDQSSSINYLSKINQAAFKPQPWRQLQRVLRETGHSKAAQQVGIAFEKRLRGARQHVRMPKNPRYLQYPYIWLCWVLHYSFGILADYGYRPLKLGIWTLAMWAVCAIWYWHAAACGVFSPTSPLVFQNDLRYMDCKNYGTSVAKPEPTSWWHHRVTHNWYYCGSLEEEYPSFSPLAYSADVIMPVVDLQQQDAWSPIISTPEENPITEFFALDIKHVTRLITWFENLFGWLSGLLLAAMLTGLSQRSEE